MLCPDVRLTRIEQAFYIIIVMNNAEVREAR